ncbi:MAG: DUF63 family protein [Halobacteriota archaeon]|uniref:DUF63 family protein n=1 Tax=Halodesulfurarchaeum sp. HSR-GB TaxID=3074077 RepID=UPI002862A365|nr:DUF63 family protein [Halodesulfurarchaeum sp. HSR-GB]MDR5657559.1 DUF63 family protein [Halodesulfurarchaeum sp. HSR-GB]
MAFPSTQVERLWTGAVGTILAVLVGGSVLFPERVYGGFVWQYFWGPVAADAHGAQAAAYNGGDPIFFDSVAGASGVAGPIAYPGYTIVSEIGYAITLLVALAGIVFLLDRLDFEERPQLIYPLLPFMLFGGALRVVEDAHDTLAVGAGLIEFPLIALFISPFIYVTVFVLAMAALLVSLRLRNQGHTDSFEWPLFGFGSGMLVLSLGYLLYLSVTQPQVEFHPAFTILTMGGATLIAVLGWWALRKYVPAVADGTPVVGAVILWAHAVDGVANVLGIDWGAELGLAADMVPKHPANRAIIDLTVAIVPEGITAVIGVAWGFLLVKIVAATIVTWLFDEQMITEGPRFSTLLLIAVVAVGLGPGVRDMLRATFGV